MIKNEKEKFIYDNYLKEGEERKKFLEYKCKETQFVNSVVKKNFIELVILFIKTKAVFMLRKKKIYFPERFQR